MKTDLTKLALASALCVGTAGLASAATSGIDIVNGSTHAGVDVSVTLQESSLTGYDFEFVINNNSGANGAAITGLYVESGWADSGLLSGSAFDRNQSSTDGGENFIEGGSDPSIAGWTDSMVSYEVRKSGAGADIIWEGVDEGESARLAFKAANSSVTLADLEAAFGSTGFNIGVRLQDLFTNDNYVNGWGLTTDNGIAGPPPTDNGNGEISGAPTPTAAAAGLALLAIAGYRRRRDG